MAADQENAAAVHIQRVVRGFSGRLAALRRANSVYEKIWDPRTHAFYYYNTNTCETTWQPPAVVTRILGEFGDLDTIAPTYTEEEAAVMLQAAWRRRRGLRMARALLASVVSKVLDESTGAYYYFNSLTGETSWSKPALFGIEDVENYPLGGLLTEGQESGDHYGTGSYGYDQSQNGNCPLLIFVERTQSATATGTGPLMKGSGGQEAWTEEQQRQRQPGDAEGNIAEGSGYEGWVWDNTTGWYYDELLAAKLTGEIDGPSASPGSASEDGGDTGSDGSSSENNSSSGDDAGADAKAMDRQERRRKRRRRSLAPRNYPRSKAQRLVDEAEDSVDGARPEVLDLSGLDMGRVSSRLYRLDWLHRLDLSRNRLCRISPDMAGMESLLDLNLRQNRIETIPDDLEALTNLKHLRLGHNRIRGFRGNIYLISSLETLDLGHNRLKEVPLQVGDLQLLKRTREWEVGLRLLRKLVTLDLSYNQLKEWPPQIEGCRNLRDLRLDHNRLREVPEIIGDNKALTSLNLSGNSFQSLPKTINSLSELTNFDLSDNKLKSTSLLPVGRREKGPRLASLEVLRLERNDLTEGPVAVESFKTLTDLNVSNNPIERWAPDVAGLRKMRHLRLKGVGLGQCPQGIDQLNKLETLDLSDNRLDVVEQSMGGLFKLKMLDVSGNEIPELGSCVGSMVSLTHLDASRNDLELIAPELSRCTALEFLDLSRGTIDAIPESFSRLTRLRILRVQDNDLGAISPNLATLTALSELRLGGNRLRTLPDALRSLTKMRYAELSRNLMESPPAVTYHWPLLTHLVLSRNPLKGRHYESLRLLQAAKRGHDAMQRGDWEEATRCLGAAADAYKNAIHAVPDFPDRDGRGPPLAVTRPHAMHTFHHVNLGLAHLQGAREVSKEMEGMSKAGAVPADGSSTAGDGSLSTQSADAVDEGSSSVTMSTGARETRRQEELRLLSLQEKRKRHHQAAFAAFSYADSLEQLSRPVGRSAEVWLGRAAVAADMGNPAAAVDDLELALSQLRKSAKVRILLAESRIELGQYERGLTDCAVASRLLDTEQRLLEKREADQEKKDRAAAAQAAKAEYILVADENLAARGRQAADREDGKSEVESNQPPAAGAERAEAVAFRKAKGIGEDEPTATRASAGEPEAAAARTPASATTSPCADASSALPVDGFRAGAEQPQPAAGRAADGGAVVAVGAATVGGAGEEALAFGNQGEETPRQDVREAVSVGTGIDLGGRESVGEDRDSEGKKRESQAGEPLVGRGKQHDKDADGQTSISTTVGREQPPTAEVAGDTPPGGAEVSTLVVAPAGLEAASKERHAVLGSAAPASAGSSVRKHSRAEGAKDTGTSGTSPARLELGKCRADIELLRADAKEGMGFVAQSVDMADVLRGFVFNRSGIPVRDPGIGLELLREGRSSLRDRHRRLMAVEAAKARQRTRDAALAARALREAASRQEVALAIKARRAAEMAKYRSIEEAWERQQEEKESAPAEEASKIVFGATAQSSTGSVESDGAASDALAESAKLASSVEGGASATRTPKDGGEIDKEEDDEDEDEDDPELQKVLARRAKGGTRKPGRRR